MTILNGCFPSFLPKEEIKKEIHQQDVSLKWIDVIGTLDQDFPDYILVQRGEETDTICHSHNIADLLLRKDTITIGFYGTSKLYGEPVAIPEGILHFTIEIDTSFAKHK